VLGVRAGPVGPVARGISLRTLTRQRLIARAQVSLSENGSTLTVTWAVYPRSFWRKLFIARARRPVLAEEVRASLAGMDHYLRTAKSRPAPAG